MIKINFQKSKGRKVSIYQIYHRNNIVYFLEGTVTNPAIWIGSLPGQ